MSKIPVYKIGDLVDFNGKKAKIIDVQERDYFYGAESPYFEYKIELTDGGGMHVVFEPALQPLTTRPKTDRLCECGAWAVHWASGQHARYCPAYNLFTVTED